MKKYKTYLYILSIVLAIGIIYFSTLLYSSGEVGYSEELVSSKITE